MASVQEMSHVSGAADPALLEDTVGAILERAAVRWPETEALVSVDQAIRWTYQELNHRVDGVAAGLLSLGLERGDRVGIWAPELRRMVAHAVRHRAGRTDSGQHQPGISTRRARIHAQQGRREGADRRRIVQDQRLRRRCSRRSHPRSRAVRPARSQAARLPAASTHGRKIGGHARRAGSVRRDHPRDHAPRAAARRRCRGRRAQPINIQFTSGTTGLPKGATLSHRNIVNNAYFVGAQHGPARRRSSVRAGAAVSLLRYGHVESRLRTCTARRSCIRPPASIRSRCCRPCRTSAAPHCTACQRCSSPSCSIRASSEFDLSIAARRHHGGLALSDRSHAPGCRAHAHARSHDRVRHDRDEPGELPEFAARFTRAARDDRRTHPAAHGSKIIDDRRAHRAARGDRRALHARLRSDARLLGRSRNEPPKRSTRRAGCTPAISARSTTRATATSSDAART